MTTRRSIVASPWRRSRRHRAGVLASAASVVLALGMVFTSSAAAASISPRAVEGGPGTAFPCPTGETCVSLPCSTSACPTVEAAPTSNLGSDQWVYLNFVNFPKGNVLEVDYCSNKVALAKAAPLCDVTGTATLQYPQQEIPIFPDGQAVTSFHVQSDLDSPGDTPFSGLVPGSSPEQSGSFWCDNGPNLCSIDVVDPYMTSNYSVTPQVSDTIVVPVTFQPATSGCPGAQFLYTSSDFSVEQLFPHETPLACTGSHPVIPLNTATDAVNALQNLTSGSSQIAFVTDPTSPDMQVILAATHTRYALIPVAASAVVIGYQATMQHGSGSFYGFSNMRLTASEVAGLITYNYPAPYGSDIVECPASLVKQLGGTPTGKTSPCPLIEGLNAAKNYTPAQSYGSFIPSYHSGVTRELVTWICSAPNPLIRVDGHNIDDPNLASTELTTSSWDPTWPIKSCAPFDQFPAVPSPSDTEYALLNAPAIQAKFLRAYLPPAQFENRPEAAFAPLDWSEARYQGLDVAALQNASGVFVQPTPASVEAGLSAATVGPDGVLDPDWTSTNPAVYPLPSVTYAIVPVGAEPAAEGNSMRTLLDSLLAFTGGAESAELPDGYVPLPSAMYQSALSDVLTDITIAKSTTPPPHKGGGGGSKPPATTTTSTTTTTEVPSGLGATTPASLPPTTVVHHHSSGAPNPVAPVVQVAKSIAPAVIHFAGVVLHSSAFRWALPVVGGVGVVSAVPGGLLLFSRRRRRARVT
jgi:hypothetical protein